MAATSRGILLFILSGCCLLGAWAQEKSVTVERGVSVRMRDGVVLFADIYRPSIPGRFPVLLERTPYDKDKDNEIDLGHDAAQLGYVVIVQDVRGRYSSGGEWYPFRHESQDGFDTVEWAAALPYSDGRVGMFGSSYVGATQMLAAIAHPPHLAGICPMFTPSNYHDGWIYQGGAFEQWFNQTWTSILARDTVDRYLKSVWAARSSRRVSPRSLLLIISTGSPIRTSMSIGVPGRSKTTIPRFVCRL
jgi:putative CocE/NonD family hydrolase